MMNIWAEGWVQNHMWMRMRKRAGLINMPDPCNEILDGLGQYQNRKYRHNWMKCLVDMRILILNMFNACTDKPFKQNCLAESWKHYQMLGLDARTSLYFFIRNQEVRMWLYEVNKGEDATKDKAETATDSQKQYPGFQNYMYISKMSRRGFSNATF